MTGLNNIRDWGEAEQHIGMTNDVIGFTPVVIPAKAGNQRK
jgi:hypothetical protein